MDPPEFDPYLELLGIPKSEQPPNNYRLLGIPEYTANKQVIANGAARQMQFLRRVGGDQFLDEVQKILNEISKARIVLLDDEKREEYDKKLKENERAKSGKPGSGSDSVSRSQSQFDLLAPAQRELGAAAPIQLIFLSGPRVGEVISLRSRDVSFGPSSRFDVMLPTRNGAAFKLEHEIDHWVLTSDETSYAVNGRLISGLTTVKDGDILRFSADGPDLQFVEEVDLAQILNSLGKYESLVANQSAAHSASFSKSKANLSHSNPASGTRPRQPSQPTQPNQRPRRQPARPQQGRPQQPTRAHQSKLVKKPDSQKSQGVGGTLVAIANRALGKDDEFTKKKGMSFDWQMGVFWLAVGGTLAAIAALIIFAVRS